MAANMISFLVYFPLYSFIATITHEYAHFMALKLLGGEGFIYFGIGPLIFPWDESHVVVQSLAVSPLNTFIFTTSGSLFAIALLIALYFSQNYRVVRAAIELAIMPQIAWTIVEPLAWVGRQVPEVSQVTGIVPSTDAYHIILLGSWLIGSIHLFGIHRRLPFFSKTLR